MASTVSQTLPSDRSGIGGMEDEGLLQYDIKCSLYRYLQSNLEMLMLHVINYVLSPEHVHKSLAITQFDGALEEV